MAPHSGDDVGSSDGISKPEESPPASSLSMPEDPMSIPSSSKSKIPSPPILDGLTMKKSQKISSEHCSVPQGTLDLWDMIFEKCPSRNRNSVKLITIDDKKTIVAHKSVLSLASPVFEELLKKGEPVLKINRVPHGALRTFIRLLYSSCYEKEDMDNFALHVLRLSHIFDVPFLKRFCIKYLEHYWLNSTNVLNVFQVARECNLPRLSFICFRQIFRNFEMIIMSKEWRDMSRNNHALEEELLQAVNFRKQEILRKSHAKKGYLQLHAANEALVHIYMHRCDIIIHPEKLRKGKQVICYYPKCKEIKNLFLHFDSCETKVSGGCNTCRTLWKLLELHSRMCDAHHSCDVPLCSYFREKVKQQCRKDEIKWKLLAIKVKKAKSYSNPWAA